MITLVPLIAVTRTARRHYLAVARRAAIAAARGHINTAIAAGYPCSLCGHIVPVARHDRRWIDAVDDAFRTHYRTCRREVTR